MLRARRCGALGLGAALLIACGLAACGEGAAGEAVVKVGRTPITRAAVEHWMSVIAGEGSPPVGRPQPEVPAPPRYGACIAYRRKYPAPSVAGQPKPTPLQLKRECELEYRKEKLKALYVLISSEWISGEARELGVSVSSDAVKRQLVQLGSGARNESRVRRFLVGTRGTAHDLRSRIRQALLVTRIQQKLEARNRQKGLATAQRQQALNRFGERFSSKWRARTSCRSGYVVPICRQYKTPKVPPTLTPPRVPLTILGAE